MDRETGGRARINSLAALREATEAFRMTSETMRVAVDAQRKVINSQQKMIDGQIQTISNSEKMINGLNDELGIQRAEKIDIMRKKETLVKKIQRSHTYNMTMTFVAVGALSVLGGFIWGRNDKAGNFGYRPVMAQIDNLNTELKDVKHELGELKKESAKGIEDVSKKLNTLSDNLKRQTATQQETAHGREPEEHRPSDVGKRTMSGTGETVPTVMAKDGKPRTAVEPITLEIVIKTEPKETPKETQKTPQRVFETVSFNELKQRFGDSAGPYQVDPDYMLYMFHRVEGWLDRNEKKFMVYSDDEVFVVKYDIGDQGISVEITYPEKKATVTVPPEVDYVAMRLANIFNVNRRSIFMNRSMNIIEQKLREAKINGKSSARMSGKREATFEYIDDTLIVRFDIEGHVAYTHFGKGKICADY